jgi:hypothetical protein
VCISTNHVQSLENHETQGIYSLLQDPDDVIDEVCINSVARGSLNIQSKYYCIVADIIPTTGLPRTITYRLQRQQACHHIAMYVDTSVL